MKKFAVVLISSLLFSYFAEAATTALTNSLLEFEAITNFIGEPGFTTIGPDEFITDIDRLTFDINVFGTVEYTICTERVLSSMDTNGGNNRRFHEYLATLDVEPNTGIGPNVVTVLSIVPFDDLN